MSAAPRERPHILADGLEAERVSDATLEMASARLIGASGGPAGRAAVQRFLAGAATAEIDLSRFWLARRPGAKRVLASCLLAPSTGGTGMVFTSTPASAEEARALELALRSACDHAEGVRLAQSLLEPGADAVRRVVERAGFSHVGNLAYLRRAWRAVPDEAEPGWPAGVSVEPWSEGDDADVMAALERSYVDTLDCPELCGMRRLEDVLESHRGAGVWDPDLWWIVRREGEPHGVLLLTTFPDQGHAELVYLGLGPEVRGLGLGGRLLRHGLRALTRRRCRDLTCAVDTRNAPARRLYEAHGFSAFSERVALVRKLG
jgi:ribosomal protein S18 acetylase RimI-like enzyme